MVRSNFRLAVLYKSFHRVLSEYRKKSVATNSSFAMRNCPMSVDIAKIQKWCLLRRFIDPILTDWLFEPSLGLTEKSNNFITVQAMTPSLANCPKNYLGTV